MWRIKAPDCVWIVGLFVAAFAVYYPTFSAGFVWNDLDYVTKPELRPFSGLARIWFQLGATEQYYPLLHSFFWLEHRCWGDLPLGYHAVNILLHATSASLLWLILRRLAVPGAWLAALLFVVHPVCVESVAWVSEQKNTLSTVFCLAAAFYYLRFAEIGPGVGQRARLVRCRLGENGRSRSTYAFGAVCFVLALLSKSVTATLPAALLVLIWWRRGGLQWRRDVLPLVPWFSLGAASGLFSAWVERTYLGASGHDFALNGVERTLVAGRAIWFYCGKLLWPVHLIFIYPHWTVNAASPAQYLYPLAAVAMTVALALGAANAPGLPAIALAKEGGRVPPFAAGVPHYWFDRARARAALAAWLIFVGSLFPTLGFLNVFAFIFSYVADHWQYLASIAVLTLIAAGATLALQRSSGVPRRCGQALVTLAVALLAAKAWTECGHYRDVKTFYRAILERNPQAWMAHNNLGIELEHEGQLDAAIEHYQAGVRLRPGYAEAHCNLGLALCKAGRIEEGIGNYITALQTEPANAVIHNDLGVALARLGRVPEAIAEYQTAGQLNPSYLDPALNLGFAYFRVRRFSESAASYERALRLQPDNANAENCLGLALASEDRGDQAMAHYRQAIRINPGYAEAHCNLGAALGAAGRFDEATVEFQTALRSDNQMADAHYNLGMIWAMRRQLAPAVSEFQAAATLRPGFANAELHWGWVLQAMGRPAEAQIHLERAERLGAGSGAGP